MGFPVRLIDLVYLRVSQINGCAYCIAIGLVNAYSRVGISFRAMPLAVVKYSGQQRSPSRAAS